MWQLVRKMAVHETATARITVDLAPESFGICALEAPEFGASLTLPRNRRRLRLVEPGAPLKDLYIRGDDVVASYAPAGDRVSYQVYWRSLETEPGRAAIGVELIVSAQTDHLEAEPAAVVKSDFPNGASLAGGGWILVPSENESYVELADVSHHQASELKTMPDDSATLTHQLFPGKLEKGVIRRARLRAFILPAATDAQRVEELYAAFIGSALPLTT
jgi:hypothetical protein